ncbi:MAG TPA: hypothetical protein VLG13_02770 [Patescibacteria group bacterium]|nr:hypothetical protein [Patescibacteria group bacterium]
MPAAQDTEPSVPVQPSLEELAVEIAAQRVQAIAAKSQTPIPQKESGPTLAKEHPRKGGAFGGALRRRLDTSTTSESADFTEEDLLEVTPIKLGHSLFTREGDQSFRSVVFTPEEFGVITFSAQTLAKRIGTRVLTGTVGREPSERNARKAQVIRERLETQLQRVEACLTNLGVDLDVLLTLGNEMKHPGYAHLQGDEMDAVVAHSEGVYVSMFEAILTNRGLGTNRVRALTLAMYSKMEGPKYKESFSYRHHLNNLGIDWTRAKTRHLTEVHTNVQNELNERFGQPA